MNLEFKESVWKGTFKPTEASAVFEEKLRAKLGLAQRYDSARLAIGRSLAQPDAPPPIPAETKFGKPIPGEYLFGEEIDLWICAVVMDGQLGEAATLDDFRSMVESHWARGSLLLNSELEHCADDEPKFVGRLSDFLPEMGDASGSGSLAPGAEGEIRLKVGSVSRTFPGGEAIDFAINGKGTSPHIALMGKVGSGKTTTGVQMAIEIAQKARIPFLFIDPKGEFVSDGQLAGSLAEAGLDIQAIEVGGQSIPLDFLPEVTGGSVSVQNAAMQFRDSIALCCKGAGDIQQDLLRIAIEKVIRRSRPRDLHAIKDAYQDELDRAGKGHDSILSRLNEVTSLKCFSPEMSPVNFFSQSWVISLKALGSEELKRLVILLLLDAVKAFTLSQNDAGVVGGFRNLRHLLVIDEARRILAEKRYQSLVDLVRQGRSKGSVVMLLSQDPGDFDGQADDFTTQLGAVIAFACAQTQRGLRSLQGVYGRKLQPNEFADTFLPPGIAFAKLPGSPAERIHCWGDIAVESGNR